MPEIAEWARGTMTLNPNRRMPHMPVLDGWRGISIVAVLMAHMLPLGPKSLMLNSAFALFGMAIFFTLSGFLITSTLIFYPSVRMFAIRRLCRIVPAAWLFMVITLTALHAPLSMWLADLFFYSNLPPFHLVQITGHLWSLCVEMQFYLGIGVLFLLLRQRGLALLPFLCVAVTLWRIYTGNAASIVTVYRVDEIFSGASLAYFFHGPFSAQLKRALARISPFIPLALLCLGCHSLFPWMNYLRPYFAAILVGATLFQHGSYWNKVLESKPLFYLANISYALYVWHPLTTSGWFEAGSKLAIYAKRPLGIALSFLLAHVSTFYFESQWINLGKRLTQKRRAGSQPVPQPQLESPHSNVRVPSVTNAKSEAAQAPPCRIAGEVDNVPFAERSE
jgi:peptidoglycan/LPS O-acetylase OafA/YrhL